MLREEEADIYFLVVEVVYGLIRRQREREKRDLNVRLGNHGSTARE